jgi:hypothetical protein
LKFILQDRSFGDLLVPVNVDWDIRRYSHAAIGGPKRATITATGSDEDLWELVRHLRSPAIIYSDHGLPLWWGYVAETRITTSNRFSNKTGRVTASTNIDQLHNRIAVAYAKVDATTGAEERDTTAWEDDDDSQTDYGIKELLWSCSAATEEHALAARSAKLAQDKWPTTYITPAYDAMTSGAELICRGWWDTTGWRYYANSGTAAVDTAEQVYDILTAKGAFFSSIRQDVTSGILLRETRDGDSTALYEATQLLEMGTDNYRRMLAKVDSIRSVRIYEEPANLSTSAYQLAQDFSLYDSYGTEVDKETCPAGVWVVLKDVIPPSLDVLQMSDPTRMFIEEMEYEPKADRLIPKPRGFLDAFDFPKAKDG